MMAVSGKAIARAAPVDFVYTPSASTQPCTQTVLVPQADLRFTATARLVVASCQARAAVMVLGALTFAQIFGAWELRSLLRQLRCDFYPAGPRFICRWYTAGGGCACVV